MGDHLNTDKSQGCCFCYTGNKHRYFKDLKNILPIENNLKVLDIFSGAGSIATSLNPTWVITGNDVEHRIVGIHKYFQELVSIHGVEDTFREVVSYCHTKVSSRDDVEGFNRIKAQYNQHTYLVDLYVLLTSSNSNYIRFNKSGEFNVQFGKRWLNPSLQKKLYNYLERVSKRNLTWESKDFREFNLIDYDIVVTDPPYVYGGKSVATYNENGGWQFKDLVNLLSKLDNYHEHGGKFVFFNEIITKGLDNTVIQDWVNKYNVKILRDTMSGCNYQRTDKRTVEVMVHNF